MIEVRHARESDLGRLTEINNHYILNSYATFDLEPQKTDQRRDWFNKFKASGPYQLLVAEQDGVVLGCAYSSRYRDHFAFDKTVETSVYLDPEQRAKGVGSLLYKELFAKLESENLHVAVVGIALPNEGSIALHRKFDFEEVGVFKEYAVKKTKYISSIWMQKRLGSK